MNLIKHHIFARFRRSQAGIAATEFALTAPILIILMLGGYEFARNTIVQLKLEKVAFTVADITAQAETLTNAQVNDILFSASQIMQPYTFSNMGVIHISSVYRAQGSNNTNVIWKRSGGGSSTSTSTVGAVGLTATLPGNLTLNEKDNVIVVEVFYNYTPIFRLGFLPATINMKKTTVFKPRLGALTTPPT